MSDTIDGLKEAEKEAMLEKDRSRGVCWQSGNSTGGLILIGIGVIFLLNQTTGFFIHNWWALFILIPAVHNLREAWHSYRVNGRVGSSLMGGILFTMVAAFFLFNLSWSLFWPVAIIVVGVSALLNAQDK